MLQANSMSLGIQEIVTDKKLCCDALSLCSSTLTGNGAVLVAVAPVERPGLLYVGLVSEKGKWTVLFSDLLLKQSSRAAITALQWLRSTDQRKLLVVGYSTGSFSILVSSEGSCEFITTSNGFPGETILSISYYRLSGDIYLVLYQSGDYISLVSIDALCSSGEADALRVFKLHGLCSSPNSIFCPSFAYTSLSFSTDDGLSPEIPVVVFGKFYAATFKLPVLAKSAVIPSLSGSIFSLAKHLLSSAPAVPISRDADCELIDRLTRLPPEVTARRGGSVSPVSPVSALTDPGREAETVSVRGDCALVTDSLGRVALLSLSTLTVLRVWKGYRDAGVGGLGEGRCLLHAPRRGALTELWGARDEKRIGCLAGVGIFRFLDAGLVLFPGEGRLVKLTESVGSELTPAEALEMGSVSLAQKFTPQQILLYHMRWPPQPSLTALTIAALRRCAGDERVSRELVKLELYLEILTPAPQPSPGGSWAESEFGLRLQALADSGSLAAGESPAGLSDYLAWLGLHLPGTPRFSTSRLVDLPGGEVPGYAEFVSAAPEALAGWIFPLLLTSPFGHKSVSAAFKAFLSLTEIHLLSWFAAQTLARLLAVPAPARGVSDPPAVVSLHAHVSRDLVRAELGCAGRARLPQVVLLSAWLGLKEEVNGALPSLERVMSQPHASLEIVTLDAWSAAEGAAGGAESLGAALHACLYTVFRADRLRDAEALGTALKRLSDLDSSLRVTSRLADVIYRLFFTRPGALTTKAALLALACEDGEPAGDPDWVCRCLEASPLEPDLSGELDRVETLLLAELAGLEPPGEAGRLDFLVRASETQAVKAAALAERGGLGRELQTRVLTNLLLAGRDSELDKFPGSTDILAEAAASAMLARLAAVVHILCDDSSEFHSIVFFAVPQRLLADLLARPPPPEAAAFVDRVGVVSSLMSVLALARLPGPSEVAAAAESLLRGIREEID